MENSMRHLKKLKIELLRVCLCVCVCVCVKSLQSCPTLCNPYGLWPGSSVCEILQARIVEWVAMPSSRESSQPRDWIHISYVSCTGRWILYHKITWEALELPITQQFHFWIFMWKKKSSETSRARYPNSLVAYVLKWPWFLIWALGHWKLQANEARDKPMVKI